MLHKFRPTFSFSLKDIRLRRTRAMPWCPSSVLRLNSNARSTSPCSARRLSTMDALRVQSQSLMCRFARHFQTGVYAVAILSAVSINLHSALQVKNLLFFFFLIMHKFSELSNVMQLRRILNIKLKHRFIYAIIFVGAWHGATRKRLNITGHSNSIVICRWCKAPQ